MTRRYLTRTEWLALHDAQGGCCAICGKPLPRETTADHRIPGWFVGHKDKPDQLICRPCDKIKTAADLKRIGKTKRQEAKAPSRLAAIRTLTREVRKRKLAGRPFPKIKRALSDLKWKKKVDGSVCLRGS